MALLDRPLYGSGATGTFARALAFRRTLNWPTVAKLPGSACRPSSAQAAQRSLYAAALAAWRALPDGSRSYYNTHKPSTLSGFNFFIRLHFFPLLGFFGFSIFGSTFFQCAASPVQPSPAEYASSFPSALDEFPTLEDGEHSPQAWLFTRIYDTLLTIEDYLILYKTNIET